VKTNKVFIIGSGNMAAALALSCLNSNIEMIGIYSKNLITANELSKKFKLKIFENIKDIPKKLDLYFLCVNDDSIKVISTELEAIDGLLVHFSGLKSINEIINHKNKAVFWPIESINKNTFVSFKDTPICIEANSETNLTIIESFAKSVSNDIININSSNRQYLHLAATITNNFSNHLINLAKNELENQHLNYILLKNLLTKSINNAFLFDPNTIQTGPAVRNDMNTMNDHLSLIKNDNLKSLYKLFSKSIFEVKENNNA
jgi:predicted short-subunit dehydrogenase-like oxidoreductase (DUF2520 family)